MAKRKAKFTCEKCGAVHVFSETDEGFEVELEPEEPKVEKRRKKEPDFFGWMLGREGTEEEGKE